MSGRLNSRIKTSEERAACGLHPKRLDGGWGDMGRRSRLELGVEGAGGSLYPLRSRRSSLA